MPYRLQTDEPLAAALKRVAEEQLTQAIEQLQSTADLGARIYALRRCLKKERAVLRLVEKQLGPAYIAENRRLREVARHFSGLRDADVSRELLETFATHYKRKTTLNPYRKALSEQHSAMQQSNWQTLVAESIDALTAARKRIEDWPLHHLSRASLEAEVKKARKQSRQAFHHAAKIRTAETFHEFRKAVKLELNQLRLLEPVDPHIRALKKLSDVLGHHHNLAVLRASLPGSSQRFRNVMGKQLNADEAEVLELAGPVYGE
jgi:CHAD domain-containing protein